MAWNQDIATQLGRAYGLGDNFVATGGALAAAMEKDPELKRLVVGMNQGTLSQADLQKSLVARQVQAKQAAIPDYGKLAQPAYKEFTPYDKPAPEFTPFGMEQFEASPDYNFRIDEGNKAMDRAGAARGNFYSGAALKDAARFGSNLAASEYDASRNRYNQDYNTDYGRYVDDRNFYNQDFNTGYNQATNNDDTLFNRFATLSGRGSSAAGSNASNATNFANTATGIYGQAANATAAGGVANANNLTGTISNVSDVLKNSFGQSSYGNLPWKNQGNINQQTRRSY